MAMAPATPAAGLRVLISHAVGLKHMNFSGDNVYCVCAVTPSAPSSASTAQFETRCIRGSLEPVWNESHDFSIWQPGDGLEFIIYDKGLLRSRMEGKAVLRAEQIPPEGFEGELPIEGLTDAHLKVCVMPGAVSDPVETLQRLQVSMLSASGLRHLNMTGDYMYCVCEVQHTRRGASAVQCQTDAVESLDPVWNAVREISPWEVGDSLRFTIYDKGLISSKTEGSALLTSERFYPHGFVGEIPIEGPFPDVFLKVCVLPVGQKSKAAAAPEETVAAEKAAAALQETAAPEQAAAAPEETAVADTRSQEFAEPPALAKDPINSPQSRALVQDSSCEAEVSASPVGSPETPMALKVLIVSASGLKHLNMAGDNMYCVCEVQHKGSRAISAKCQTDAQASLDPVWNAAHKLSPWKVGENLRFTIYDKGLLGSKTAGSVELPSDQFYLHGFEGELQIEGLPHASLKVSVVPMEPGRSSLVDSLSAQRKGIPAGEALSLTTPMPSTPRRGPKRLHILMMSSTGLQHLNMVGDSMYCVCEVQRIQENTSCVQCQTDIQASLEPVWNAARELGPWEVGENLKFTIYDKGMFGSKPAGSASLPSERFYPSGFEGNLPLEGLPEATLSVTVRVAPDVSAGEDGIAIRRPTSKEAVQKPPVKQRLQVSIVQAFGLKALNMVGRNTYCVCRAGQAQTSSCRTQDTSNTLEPVWNETFELDPWQVGEALEFTVHDQGSSAEGKGSLPSDYFHPNGFVGDVPLEGLDDTLVHVRVYPAGPSTGAQYAAPSVTPAAPLATSPGQATSEDNPARTLQVRIFQATGLKHLNMTGDNIYCECKLLCADKKAEPEVWSTKQIKNVLNPVWNETHDMGPCQVGDALEFTVRDHGLIGSKTEGKAILPSDYIYPSGFEGELPIEGLPKATLHIQVQLKAQASEGRKAALPKMKIHAEGPAMSLTLIILRAVGLKHLRMVESNTYCVCRVLHADKRENASTCQTKKSYRSGDPTWNETLCIDSWHVGELLEFQVNGTSRTGLKIQGKAILPSEYIYPDGFEGELPINGLNTTMLQVRIFPPGRGPKINADTLRSAQLASPALGAKQLQISVIHATGLQNLDLAGEAPFCVCRVPRIDGSPAKLLGAFYTKRIRGTLDPVWNETHVLDSWQLGQPVEFTVYDRGLCSTQREGRGVRIQSESFYPNGFQGDLPINGIPNATLHVRIIPIEQAITQAGPSSATRPVPMVLTSNKGAASASLSQASPRTSLRAGGSRIPGEDSLGEQDANHDSVLDRSELAKAAANIMAGDANRKSAGPAANQIIGNGQSAGYAVSSSTRAFSPTYGAYSVASTRRTSPTSSIALPQYMMPGRMAYPTYPMAVTQVPSAVPSLGPSVQPSLQASPQPTPQPSRPSSLQASRSNSRRPSYSPPVDAIYRGPHTAPSSSPYGSPHIATSVPSVAPSLGPFPPTSRSLATTSLMASPAPQLQPTSAPMLTAPRLQLAVARPLLTRI